MWISSRRMASRWPGHRLAGVHIDWSVDGPDATGASLRAVPGTRDSIEYRPPALGARGRVVVRAELRNEDCPGGARAAEACSAEFPLRIVAPGPPTLLVFVGRQRVGRAPAGVDRRPGGRNRSAEGYRSIGFRGGTPIRSGEPKPREVSRRLGPWSDVPGSTGETRSYRVKGLRPGRLHIFQVRPLAATGPGMALRPGRGPRVRAFDERHPTGTLGSTTRERPSVRLDYCSFVVPDGMHVEIPWLTDIGPQYSGSPLGLGLFDVKTRSMMLVNVSACELVLQHISVPHPPPGYRDVRQLFEQIADSLERIRYP